MQSIDDLRHLEPQAEIKSAQSRLVADMVVESLAEEAHKLKLEETQQPFVYSITSLLARLRTNEEFSADKLIEALSQIRNGLILSLKDLKFAYIPPSHDQYFEQDQLFGEKVNSNFSSVRDEIRDAGNCLAADLGTAAVFHLMRVAEKGMKVVLKDRQIIVVQNKPTDLLDWKTIGDGMDQAIEAINNWPNSLGLAKTQALEFYGGVKSEFLGFKDAWRNHVMHDRKKYSFDEAKGILSHVERLMKLLAERMAEHSYTPLVWTEKEIK